jgi:hypothetical protein
MLACFLPMVRNLGISGIYISKLIKLMNSTMTPSIGFGVKEIMPPF